MLDSEALLREIDYFHYEKKMIQHQEEEANKKSN